MEDEGKLTFGSTMEPLGQKTFILLKGWFTFFIMRTLSIGFNIFMGIVLYFFNWASIKYIGFTLYWLSNPLNFIGINNTFLLLNSIYNVPKMTSL